MKRVISAVLVLLVLGLGAFLSLEMRRHLSAQARGAALAPAETVLFVQFPNLRETARRLPKTDLYKIWQEPEVQTFLEKPRRKAPWMVEWGKRIEEMARVAPGEAFVAFTSTDGPRPSFVGGFSYAGRKANAQALATHFREQFLPGEEIASASRSSWILFASDAAALAAMIERFDGHPGPALATEGLFQNAISRVGAGQDLIVYGKPEALSGRLEALSSLRGNSKSPGPLAMGTRIDGTELHDTIFISGSGASAPSALSRQTLSVASPETLLYYVADLKVLSPDFSGVAALLPGFAGMERTLAENGLSWNDLQTALASEVALMVEWPEDAPLPALLLASETRDPAKARRIAEALLGPGRTWSQSGIALLDVSPQVVSLIRPALAVTERFALLGTTPQVVETALPRTGLGSPTLGETPAFQELAKRVPDDAVAFGYLDFRSLFTRVYRMARPFITLSMAFSAEAGAQFDAGKLPPVEAISKNLSPSLIIQKPTEDGILIESIGSLTVPELLLGVSAGGAASGLSEALGGGAKRGKPKTAPKLSTTPSIRSEETATVSPTPEKKAAEHK